MKKVIVVDYKLFAKDVCEEFQKLNYEVIYITHKEILELGLMKIVELIKPYFLFTINFSPEIALLCSKCDTLYISWTIDPLPPVRFSFLDGILNKNVLIFAHRKEDVVKFRNKGFENVHHLLLAASAKRTIDGKFQNSFKYEISFVGVTLQNEILEFYKYLEFLRIDKKIVEEILFGDYENVITTEKVYNEELGEIPVKILGMIEDIENVNFAYLSSLINGFYSFHHRTKTVKSINGISVFGDNYWENIGVKYFGYANHEKMLNDIYQTSKLNFDVSRFYQKSSINMRVFDSMACGGVILTESCDSINQIFEKDVHYLDYKDENWKNSFDNTKKLNGIRLKALKEIESKHRMCHRLNVILKVLND